jgi:hypothetical protein
MGRGQEAPPHEAIEFLHAAKLHCKVSPYVLELASSLTDHLELAKHTPFRLPSPPWRPIQEPSRALGAPQQHIGASGGGCGCSVF